MRSIFFFGPFVLDRCFASLQFLPFFALLFLLLLSLSSQFLIFYACSLRCYRKLKLTNLSTTQMPHTKSFKYMKSEFCEVYRICIMMWKSIYWIACLWWAIKVHKSRITVHVVAHRFELLRMASLHLVW